MDSPNTARHAQSVETRNKIYETAIKLSKEKGFEQVTIREICKEAEVSVGLFYKYFNSKEDIFLEYSKINEDLYKNFRNSFSPEDTTLDRLISFAKTNAKSGDSLIKGAGRFVYIHALKNPGEHFMTNIDREVNTTIREIIDYGISRGEIRKDIDKEWLHRTILSCGWGCFFAYFSGIEPEVSLEDRMITAHRLIYEGVTVQKEDS